MTSVPHEVEVRLRRLERTNRFLVIVLAASFGALLIGAVVPDQPRLGRSLG